MQAKFAACYEATFWASWLKILSQGYKLLIPSRNFGIIIHKYFIAKSVSGSMTQSIEIKYLVFRDK